MKTAIIIPARYGSTRFPGKPLAKIDGITMLERVVNVAKVATKNHPDVDIMVTTEDQRIANHAKDIGVHCIITSADCPTGSDRVLEAAQKSEKNYDFIINFQGDAPLTPPEALTKIIQKFSQDSKAEVITPVKNLTWQELDALKEAKKITPFSGTTVTIDKNKNALWFSKTIIPAIRKEDRSINFSPVFQHIGIYGFSFPALKKFCALPQSRYEELEGLEQLRMLENGIKIQTVEIENLPVFSGIDSPEDLKRAEVRLKE